MYIDSKLGLEFGPVVVGREKRFENLSFPLP
uniref:Uncharacterized protein n=1 Tax=Myoviridae sp. ctQve5 TaxID=2825103 RepID=A0A8S5PUH8_9CAUD|nr:MAG TPA: hypothetical protein [Myoviridae sp. ctQve5]